MTPTLSALPQIRVSDIEILGDWDFEHVKAIGDSIPGYRSSATFLSTLRSNLHLSTCPFDHSPSPSLVSTPTVAAFSSTALFAHPNPSQLSISTSTPDFEIPYQQPVEPQTTTVNSVITPENVKNRSEAVRLIADSVAQQRQVAAKALALHPYCVTAAVLVTGIVARYCSLPLLLALSTNLIVVSMAVLHWITRDYPRRAAEIDSKWLESPLSKALNGEEKIYNSSGSGHNRNSSNVRRHSRTEDPIVLVSRSGDEIIGTLVLRVVKRERKAYIRAWTVESSHRGRGVGTALLQEGVRVAWGKGARSMEFDAGHANSYHALPQELNGTFEEQEAKARRLLGDLFAEHKREKSSR
ncbi:hypothetical protein ACLMJK_003612 [Lecanora helva]